MIVIYYNGMMGRVVVTLKIPFLFQVTAVLFAFSGFMCVQMNMCVKINECVCVSVGVSVCMCVRARMCIHNIYNRPFGRTLS